MDADKGANKSLYRKELSAKDIVEGTHTVVPAAQPLVSLLDKTSPARK